jgi:hypothetical protein
VPEHEWVHPEPPPIPDFALKQFQTLKSANNLGLIDLVSALRKSDGHAVVLLCKIEPLDDSTFNYRPMAELILSEGADGDYVWPNDPKPEKDDDA